VQIRRKLQKIHSKVRIQDKKNFEKHIPNFKSGAKKEIKGRKRGVGGGMRIFPQDTRLISKLPLGFGNKPTR
jgi:hypothetical protein